MHFRISRGLLLNVIAAVFAVSAYAQSPTPASNLAGIKQLRERVDVSLSLKGADEFGVEAGEVAKIVRTTLLASGLTFAKGDFKMPGIQISVQGESTGGGGAQFAVELVVTALLPSPFVKERSIQAIIWRGTASGHHLQRYDPATKELIKPTGLIRDRVYESVKEVASRLASDAKAS